MTGLHKRKGASNLMPFSWCIFEGPKNSLGPSERDTINSVSLLDLKYYPHYTWDATA